MCGIAGYLATRADDGLGASLRGMAAALIHRGPDDEGFFEAALRDGSGRVGLAHRRLSIIDLSTGHQPMSNEDGAIQIVFNGEIYNFQGLRAELIAKGHVFRTQSDTETIVHAYEEWGADCVMRFRGMFAFALWDARHERLLLARDRYGKKPLFYHRSGGVLLFASEIKAILAFPGVARRVDREALWHYFAYRYVPAPATLLEGIRKLMPGSYLLCERGAVTETCYFRPADGKPPDPITVADPPAAFLEQLDEAVRIRMISDVPFGAFLSGGIDSSAVVALMTRHSSLPVKTFSVGFAESRYSELAYARTIATHYATDHHELKVSQRDLMEHLPAVIRYRDAPVAEPSDIPIYLLSREARRTVKMVLTGEGADEFLGGYPKHVMERHVRGYQRLPAALRRGLVEPLCQALPYEFRRVKTAVANLALDCRCERMPRWFGALSSVERERLTTLPAPQDESAHAAWFDTRRGNSALRDILYFDQTSWLPDNLLERGDRMTMAASLEARMPFMDHELAAFVSGLPDEWRVRGLTTKRILRAAMRRVLPAAILERPKVGFRVPVNEWFRGSMRGYLTEHLTGTGSRTRGYYRPAVLQRYLDEHVSGRQNHEKLLWCLLNLEVWHREYGLCA